MSFVSTIIGTAERVPLPDAIIRAAIHRLCSRTARGSPSGNADSDAGFAHEMAARAIAEHTDEANAQHYEVPAAFFARCWGPTANIPPASTRSRPPRCRRPRKRRCARPSSMPISPTGRRSSNSAAAGARCRCGWRGNFRMRGSSRSRIRARSANTSRREAAQRGLGNLARGHRGHERCSIPSSAVRPHRLGRDVRAHDELARAADARARMAGAGRALVHACLHPSRRRLSVRPRRPRGLDRAAFLHRRRDAEPSSDPAICRSVRGREGMALERRRIISAPRSTGWPISMRNRDAIEAVLRDVYGDDTALWMRRWRWFFLATAACSVTPAAANGASAITG